jgi:hypothetical protein
MIVEFSDREYVDVTKIVALRWVETKHKGIVVFSGERIVLNKTEYQLVEDAYRWLHKRSLYGKDLVIKKLVQRDKGE